MNYTDWNIVISKHLFNESNAEKEVYLFLTEDDLVGIGRKYGLSGDDSVVFQSFIQALLYDNTPSCEDSSTPYSPIDRPLELFEEWNNSANHYEEYPYYLAYLILFILPLTGRSNPNYNYNNYYGRLNDYFDEHGIHNEIHNSRITTQNFRRIDALWEDLQDWSFSTLNTEKGYFELHQFINDRWIYVGKPLSQCIFPSYSLSSLPQLYEHFGIYPGEQLKRGEIRKILVSQGVEILDINVGVIKALQDEENELGDSIIRIVEKHYQNWNGETDLYDATEDITTRGSTLASLRLCVEADFPNETVDPYFRLYSPAEYPEDLKFEEQFDCNHQSHGFSKALWIPFEEGASYDDEYNKWKAVIPNKSVRILVKGENFHLSGWVEVAQMDAQSQMLLVAHGSVSNSIAEWGSIMEDAEFSQVNFSGFPTGYQTFLLRNPTIDHPDISNLSFIPDKRILVIGGIKTGIRTYLPQFLPEVFLENGRGDERLYLKSEESDQELDLTRKDVDRPVWLLPEKIAYNTKYIIHVYGADVRQNPSIKIVTYDATKKILDVGLLPNRDEYGVVVDDTVKKAKYATGSNVIRTNNDANRPFYLKSGLYSMFFQPTSNTAIEYETNTPDSSSANDMLLFCLSTKAVSKVQEFREAFDTIYYKRFTTKEIETHLAISKLKRWSLNMLDYMGFLDFDYGTQRIVVNPPQLIPIPASSGRRALLIGGRTPALLETLWMATEEAGLSFLYKPQDKSVDQFILPSTVTISGWDQEGYRVIEDKIHAIAKKCGVEYDPNEYPQFSLAEFSGRLNDYEESLSVDHRFNDQGWSTKVFNPELLKFERINEADLDRSFALVEYQLNEYTYVHRLWKEGEPYLLNKNWGRYMVLNRHDRNIILFEPIDSKIGVIAVPVTLPLPRLLVESLTLFSGEAPLRKQIEIDGVTRWYNVYINIPHVFAHNYFMKVGQSLVELNIQELCGIQ